MTVDALRIFNVCTTHNGGACRGSNPENLIRGSIVRRIYFLFVISVDAIGENRYGSR